MSEEKIIVPKEVAEALDDIRHMSNDEVIKLHVTAPNGWSHKALRGLSLKTLVKARFVGYEVELTPEEQLRKYYEEISEKYEDAGYGTIEELLAKAERDAIDITLRLLGIQIKGVNA
jgi:hypothetical protein